MQNDNEIFEEIKRATNLNPRTEFVVNTRHLLVKKANHISKLSKIKKRSYYWSVLIATVALTAWTFLFGGNQHIAKSYHTVMSAIPNNNEESKTASNENPSVFIYHTHTTESFTPLLNNKNPDKAYDDKKNITMVGAELTSELMKKNINVLHSTTDFNKILRDRNLDYTKIYDISGKEVQTVLDKNKKLKLIIDIHRDSQLKEATTIKINGKNVASVSFVVSENSPNFKENRKIANLLHQKLEKRYPGLSRGVLLKVSQTKNPYKQNFYNHDLFANSLLLQIGGVENTIEEENRSAELIAEAIDELLIEMD
ncbi:stage II sporulation protein P [Peribacillus muralis]|uniref:stage II sporulation protein P n=1 Tax=Peribacillus muralis TaxID=264697 RepID=UPI001F4E9CDB|nr:stage II sporulation protein P [Peribacillus muralis]MCK1993557.1 stage II sporulation protein P [Peribacillus muralis]MCK2014155.1 stage II sporulation protein P [Peribacillus muralis]